MMAAVAAAGNGHETELFEKNEKLGKKLFITGKGRCNITNAADIEEFFPAVTSNPKFLYSAFYSFTNEQVIGLFNRLGVETKTERGGRVFPVSDHSSDVIQALKQEMERLGVRIRLHSEVKELLLNEDKTKAAGLLLTSGQKIYGGCRDRGDRRHILPVHRIHRGRIPVCPGKRPPGYGAFALPCAHGSKKNGTPVN